MPSRILVTMGLTIVLLQPRAALAQDANLAGLLTRLFDAATINAQTPNPTAGLPDIAHQAHFFLGGENLTLATREFNVALAAQVSSFPLSSSSGGFSFIVTDTGEVMPRSTTFGPAFAERALTIGRGKFNVGFSFQATSYDSFEGVELDSGEINFIRRHNDCCPGGVGIVTDVGNGAPTFEYDLLRSNLNVKIDSKTTAFFANYGVTSHLDVGIAIPVTNVEIDATVDAAIVRVGSAANPFIHTFQTGVDKSTDSFSESGSATGLGDILLRAKYALFQNESTGVAAALDLRLPTGDRDNLLGTGATQTHVFVIASGEYGPISPHVNFGFTASNGHASDETISVLPRIQTAPTVNVSALREDEVDLAVPDEINYAAGVSVAAGPRVTLAFDARGRVLRDAARFSLQDTTYPSVTAGTTVTAPSEFALTSAEENANVVLGIIGGKFNVAGTFLLNVSVLFPMSNAGLEIKPTPVIGFDYVF